MTEPAPTSLTDEGFWEDTYLGAKPLPLKPSAESPFERCLMKVLAEEAAVHGDERVIEVGCAPGRWMIFYAQKFGANVSGIEYTGRGAEVTRANLAAAAVDGEVHECDFWQFEADRPYDLVLSLGFIEHFDDLDAAFERHTRLVAAGGRLALGVPNFQGLTRVLQRSFDPDWLALHNPRAMGHAPYLERARRFGLGVRANRYVGGFDPDMISTRARRWGRSVLAPFWHLRHHGFGDNVNAWWLSSYLLIVFEKPLRGRSLQDA